MIEIGSYGHPDPPVPRLLAGLAARGHQVDWLPGSQEVLVLAAGSDFDAGALEGLGAWRRPPRLLVVSAIGAHPDARAPRLRCLWALEESARASGVPVLTLRLAPLIGPESPLWLRLRSRPRLPRGGRQLLNPVAEADAVETLDRAVRGLAEWRGWYEVAGPEVVSLAELEALARECGPRLRRDAGAWEPPLAELEEHRLAEAGPWLDHFGIVPHPIAAAVGAGAS